jgi:hypothetical protein
MDKFMEILKRYKEGTANEDEKQLVELEIEKNRTINDLIADEFEDGFEDEFDYDQDSKDSKLDKGKKQKDFGEDIKRAVNRRFRKMLALSVVSILVIYAVLQLVVSPIMDSMYYDPGDITQGEHFKDIRFDMFAFTELNIPGYSSSSIYVTPKGFGQYDIIIRRRNLFEGDYERISIAQNKNRIEGFFDYKFGYDMFLNRPGGDEEEISAFDYEIPIRKLKEMDERNYVSAFVVFNEEKTLVEFWDIGEAYDLEYKWLAVDTGVDTEGRYRSYLGFNPSMNDSLTTADAPDKEKYPYFDLTSIFDSKPEEIHGKPYPEKMEYYYEHHFKSLLKYMINRDEFGNIYDLNSNRHGYYEETYDYVEKNGVKIYAMLINGEASEIVNMIENEDVYSISINDVKVSRY